MSGVGCFCDYRCHDLNDCCAAVNSTLSPLSSEGDAVPSVCLSIENVFLEDMILPSGNYVSAITHCPSEKPISEEVKLGCEEADLMLVASREENLFQWLRTHARSVVPVVSFRNRRLYGNVFCAICNGQSQDQVHFSPIHLGCRKEGNTTECLVSVKLPASLSRPCIPQRSRLLSPKVSFLSMDDLFIIPDEYLNSQYITLPLNFGKDDKNRNSTNSNKTQVSSASSNPVYDTDNRNAVYTWVQLALLIFSVVGLTLMLVVYGLTAKLRRSLAGILTMGLGIALLVMEATFLMVAFAVSHVENRGFCVFMVALLLYSLLCSFTWMTLFATQLLLTFGNCRNCFTICWKFLTCQWNTKTSTAICSRGYKHSRARKPFRKYLLVATILPLCLVLPATTINEHAFNLLSSAYFNLSSVSQPSTFDEAITEDEFASFNITTAEVLGESLAAVYPGFCPDGARSWFTNLGGLIVWLLVPAGTMITFNSLALLVVCVQICRLSKEAQLHSSPQNEQERKRRKKSKNLAGICAKLAIILGASWFVQLFAGWWSQLFVMRRILGLVNSAQGGVIAVSMLASVKARRALANVLPECCRVLVGHNSSTQQSTSREKEKSTLTTSKTWTSVLLPRRNRQQIQSIGDSS
uniref:G-protein coupled receptors family 2 profile 2 domain-containing protein n=1 Tax=Echinococcus canadensis TaxID=519352 RepID=A0A915EYS9_9CEST